jgi:hypothetical protein
MGAVLALTVTAGLASVGPVVSTASAGSSCGLYMDRVIDWEYIDGWGRFDPCGGRPVDWVDGLPGIVGHVACVGAYDVASASWAGTTVCLNGDVSHQYNNTNRIGWGGVPYGHVAEINTTDVIW